MIDDVAERTQASQVAATTLREVRISDRQRLGRDRLVAPDGFSRRPTARRSRSSTASAAATASPPACSTASWSSTTSAPPVEYGAAHGALAMTTPGDTSMATLAEVRRLVDGAGARVRR